MAIVHLKASTRTKMAQQIVDDLDAGAGSSILQFYSGTMPATPETGITTQVLLGELVCSDPSAIVAAGVITFGAIAQDAAADATGDATWARHINSDGVAVVDYDVTNTAGTGAIRLGTTNIVMGEAITMNSLVIAVGG